MSSEGPIRLERRHEGRLALLTVHRPEVRNALDRAAMAAFAEAVAELEGDPELLAVVVTGAGDRAFVAGGDLKDLHHALGRDEAMWIGETMGSALERLSGLPVPVVAAVNGSAFGAGCELMLACDYRIASESARFGFRGVQLGVMAGWGGSARLLKRVGRSRALRLLITGEEVDAAGALEMQLVDEVVAADAVLSRALELAGEFADSAPLAVRATKEALVAADEADFGPLRELETRGFVETWASEDHREALDARAEGRPPEWKGK